MEETKTCLDCSCCFRHYTIVQGRLMKLESGHCKYAQMRSKRLKENPVCKHFILREPEKEKASQNIFLRDAVLRMQKTLDDILRILSAKD